MKYISFIGGDASGKDTQIEMLKKYLEINGQTVQVVSIWDSLVEFSTIGDKKILKEIVETFLLKFSPEARSHFLLACLKNSYDKIDQKKNVIILNGFYQKYMASELTYGVGSEIWNLSAKHFNQQAVSFYIRTSFNDCLKRRSDWSKYESGQARYLRSTPYTLGEFQEKMHQHLDQIAKTISGLCSIDGGQDIQKVHEDILKHL
jgi:thymidylate kinase